MAVCVLPCEVQFCFLIWLWEMKRACHCLSSRVIKTWICIKIGWCQCNTHSGVVQRSAKFFYWMWHSRYLNFFLSLHVFIIYQPRTFILHLENSQVCRVIEKLIYFFFLIYFWLHWVFVVARRLSLVAASGGFSVAVRGLLTVVASLVAEHRL